MSKTGRNAPCQCGSGKKLKRCCGAAPDAPASHSQATRTSALKKLDRFGSRKEFENDRALAEAMFWGSYSGELSVAERETLLGEEMVIINFGNFVRFDLDIDDGRTLLDLFLQRGETPLSSAERRYLCSMQGSYVRLYEITEVRRGEGLRLRSVWGGQEDVWVVERTASRTAARWDLLGARVVQQPDGEFQFEGDIYPLPARFKSRAIEQLAQDYEVAAEAGREISTADFLKRVAFRFHGFWLEANLGNATPKLGTFDGEVLEQVTQQFAIEKRSVLVAALNACEELQAEGGGRWVLLKDVDGVHHMLADLNITDDELTLQSMSRSHGEQARALVLDIAGKAVRHVETEHSDVRALMEEARRAPRRPADSQRSDEPLPPETSAFLKQVMDTHYRNWLDDEIPALGGSTPRAAAVNIQLRPKLVDLLHQMENSELRKPSSEIGPYDFGWVWRELGLER